MAHEEADACGRVGEQRCRVHGQVQAGALQLEAVEAYAPALSGRCVHGGGVAHEDVQMGVLQHGLPQLDGHVGKVDAGRGEREAADGALQAQVAYEVGAVNLRVVQLQRIEHDGSLQQGPQPHVGHGAPDVGDGVAGHRGPDNAHPVDAQVEREVQVYVLNADLHARLLRGILRHALCHPVLDEGHIEQRCQYE